MILFSDVHHNTVFSINVYSGDELKASSFKHIANLYSPTTVDACFEHTGTGILPGMKDDEGRWSLKGHRDRIVEVTDKELDLFARLYDDEGTPALQARLPNAHSKQVVEVLRKFAAYPTRLGELKDEYLSMEMWHETNAQKDGTIKRETCFPDSPSEWILSGPHFYVGNPFYKTPRVVCRVSNHFDVLNLDTITNIYLPRTNYLPACDETEYRRRIPRITWKKTMGKRSDSKNS